MEKVEKYKSEIEKMLKIHIREKKNTIESFIKLEFENHKITQKEYNELLDFLNNKTKEIAKEYTKKQEIKKEDTDIEEIKNAFFRMQLKVEPIYKGEIGKVAPKRNSNNQKGER